MEASSHVLAGALSGLGYAAAAGLDPAAAVATSVVAGLASTTPDVCQRGWWRSMDRWTPDEVLGNGGPLQHRGISHWWGMPAAAWFLALPQSTGWAHLLLAALLVGVGSHLAGDFLVGKGGYGRGPGVPLGPWFWHVGLGIDCGGVVETWLLRPLLLLAVPVAAYYVILGGSL